MAQKKSFRNVSEKNFILNSVGERKNVFISFEPEKNHDFTQEEIDDCDQLRALINAGNLVLIEKTEPKKEDYNQVYIKNGSTNIEIEPIECLENDIVSFGDIEEEDIPFKIDKPEEPEPEPTPSIDIEDEQEEETKNDFTEIWWTGPASDAGGYGKMNREFLEKLYLKKDLKIQHVPFGIGDNRSKLKSTDSLNEMISNEVSEKAISVWAIMPPKWLPRQGRKIIYTMMECEGVPAEFIEKCNNADEVWLPSLHNMEAFAKSGLKVPAYHMPLGVDTERYKPMELTYEDKKKFNVKTKSFVFLSVFGWSKRKGCDVLLRSYLEEFTSKDDVTLVIASRYWGSSGEEEINKIRSEIKEYISKYTKEGENPPHIVHIGQAIPEEDMPILYNMADAFVLPSRGEGWGLPYMEAGACEKPVLATRCTGQMDFLNDNNSYLIDIEGYDCKSQEIKEIAKISSYYQGQSFAVLGQTALDQLKEKMRFVFENYPEAKKVAKKLRKDLKKNYTWDKLSENIYKRLKG